MKYIRELPFLQSTGNFTSKLQGFRPKMKKKGISLYTEYREESWELSGNGPYKLEYEMDYCSSKRLCGLNLTFSKSVLSVEVFWKSRE